MPHGSFQYKITDMESIKRLNALVAAATNESLEEADVQTYKQILAVVGERVDM